MKNEKKKKLAQKFGIGLLPKCIVREGKNCITIGHLYCNRRAGNGLGW